MKKLLFGLAEDSVMTSALRSQLLAFARRIERETKEMTFARIGTTGDDDRTIGFVEIDKFVEIEIGWRDRTDEGVGR
jgi:hypothetical protein